MNDLKFAIRQLFKNPDFTAVALLSLALGIGINATIFSILDTFLFRDLPFKDPDGLVVLWEVNSKQQGRRRPPTFATFDEWRAQSQSLERLGLFDGYGGSITLAGSGQATRVRSQAVDVNFFPVLGIQPALGRWFLPGDLDDRVNHDEARPIVISHQTWRHRLGGIKEVTGQMLTVDGVARPVVGVMPAARSIGGQDISDWIPRIEKVRLAYFGDAAPVFYFLHATVGLVLLIACANVANLLLAQ